MVQVVGEVAGVLGGVLQGHALAQHLTDLLHSLIIDEVSAVWPDMDVAFHGGLPHVLMKGSWLTQ